MKTKNYPHILFWSFWILVFFSCSLEKRRYFKGYYLSKKHNTLISKKKLSSGQIQNYNHTEFQYPEINRTEESAVVEKNNLKNDQGSKILISNRNKNILLNDTCKDELVFKNGERIKVKIVEITPYVVRFYNCSLQSPYVSEIPKSDLSVILPHNGKAELIDSQNNNNPNNASNKNSGGSGAKFHDEVLIGLALFALLGIVGAIYILIRYKPVRNEMLANPDKYQGKTLWDVLFYLSIGCISLALLYIFFIFAIIGL